jgi:hypothetical protein
MSSYAARLPSLASRLGPGRKDRGTCSIRPVTDRVWRLPAVIREACSATGRTASERRAQGLRRD